MRWTHVAEQCHLDRLRVRCIRQLAQGLASGGSSASRYGLGYSAPSYHLQPATPRRAGKGGPVVEALADVSELKVGPPCMGHRRRLWLLRGGLGGSGAPSAAAGAVWPLCFRSGVDHLFVGPQQSCCPLSLPLARTQGLREDALLGMLAACVASMRRCGSHHVPSAGDLEEALLPK